MQPPGLCQEGGISNLENCRLRPPASRPSHNKTSVLSGHHRWGRQPAELASTSTSQPSGLGFIQFLAAGTSFPEHQSSLIGYLSGI